MMGCQTMELTRSCMKRFDDTFVSAQELRASGIEWRYPENGAAPNRTSPLEWIHNNRLKPLKFHPDFETEIQVRHLFNLQCLLVAGLDPGHREIAFGVRDCRCPRSIGNVARQSLCIGRRHARLIHWLSQCPRLKKAAGERTEYAKRPGILCHFGPQSI